MRNEEKQKKEKGKKNRKRIHSSIARIPERPIQRVQACNIRKRAMSSPIMINILNERETDFIILGTSYNRLLISSISWSHLSNYVEILRPHQTTCRPLLRRQRLFRRLVIRGAWAQVQRASGVMETAHARAHEEPCHQASLTLFLRLENWPMSGSQSHHPLEPAANAVSNDDSWMPRLNDAACLPRHSSQTAGCSLLAATSTR
jgi:hypothetical protein